MAYQQPEEKPFLFKDLIAPHTRRNCQDQAVWGCRQRQPEPLAIRPPDGQAIVVRHLIAPPISTRKDWIQHFLVMSR
jgi:hypothetical protein